MMSKGATTASAGLAFGELCEDRQELEAVALGFLFADAVDLAKFAERTRALAADVGESRVVKDDEGGDTLFLGCGAAPLAKPVVERFVELRGGWGFGLRPAVFAA